MHGPNQPCCMFATCSEYTRVGIPKNSVPIFFYQKISANKNFSFVIHVYSCMENLFEEVSEIKSEHDLFVKFLQLWIGLFADATFYWILAVEAIDGTWD